MKLRQANLQSRPLKASIGISSHGSETNIRYFEPQKISSESAVTCVVWGGWWGGGGVCVFVCVMESTTLTWPTQEDILVFSITRGEISGVGTRN